ncbi:TM207 protein, partial [Tichodroma muraria]|nr:TM207 protein [Tichodroma muraria]
CLCVGRCAGVGTAAPSHWTGSPFYSSLFRCIGQSDENFSSWYVWFLVLFFLAVLLSCGICCCLRCWLKWWSCLPRRTMAVFALSSSDAFCATEAPPCPFSRSLSPCMTAELSSSPAPRFNLGGTELPPSYEDVMKENKL